MPTSLVVGADRGIGYALARHLDARGDRVLAACLQDGREFAGTDVVVLQGVDVTSDLAVTQLAAALDADAVQVDLLLHVAGIMGLDRLESVDFDDARRQFEVNSLGPLRVVRAVRERLATRATVGILTSRVGSLTDNTSGGDYAYRMSKAAANMVARNLHHDLAPGGVTVLALHPGMVDTQLLDVVPKEEYARYASSLRTPEDAAAALIRLVADATAERSGTFCHADGTPLPW